MIAPSFFVMFIDLDAKGRTVPLSHESEVKIFAEQNFLFSYFPRKKDTPRERSAWSTLSLCAHSRKSFVIELFAREAIVTIVKFAIDCVGNKELR